MALPSRHSASVHTASVQDVYFDRTNSSAADTSSSGVSSEIFDQENINPNFPKPAEPQKDKSTADVIILHPPGRTEQRTDIRTDCRTDIPTLMNSESVKESDEQWSLGAGKEEEVEEKWRPLKGYEKWNIDLEKLYLGKKIASGTYGRVYLGIYGNRDVAAKIMKGGAGIGEEEIEKVAKQFKQEVKMYARVAHKNIVEFLGASQKPPLFLILTEFLCNGTLRSFLQQREEPLTSLQVVTMALDIAQGMAHLQSHVQKKLQGVIHRDLKSENLIIAEDGTVKIVDFGVARLGMQGMEMTAETGTYRWMAPEMIEHKAYDYKVDVYSFGIVFWELVTGEVPFSGMTAVQAAFAVVNKNARPPIPEKVSTVFSNFIESCWHSNPNHRPDFFAIVETLKKMQNDLSGNSGSLLKSISIKDKVVKNRWFPSCFCRKHL